MQKCFVRYNISFIDPPLGEFGDISLSDDKDYI
jgi:hypothetical protein